MVIMHVRIYTLLFLLVSFFVPLAAQENKQEDLASVVILPYEDKTDTENFGYLPNSLVDAIDSSMRKDFTYHKTGTNKIEAFLKTRPGADKSSRELVEAAGKQLKADIVIFGYFVYSEESKEMTIFTGIYFAGLNEMSHLGSVSNPVDNTLFQVTDKVAGQIVDEINAIILEHREAAGQQKDEGRQKVTKEALEKRSRPWDFGIQAGPILTDQTGQSSLFNSLGADALLFELRSEQQLFGALSLYGSFGFSGFIPSEPDFALKIPFYTAISILFFVPEFLLTGRGLGYLMIDGITLNFPVSEIFMISPYFGTPFYIYAFNNNPRVLWGPETGVKFKFFLGPKNYVFADAGYFFDAIEYLRNSGLSNQHWKLSFGWSYVFSK